MDSARLFLENKSQIYKTWEALSAFTSTNGFKEIEQLLQQIESQNVSIQELNEKLQVKEAALANTQTSLVSAFGIKYTEHQDKENALNASIKRLEAAAQAKDQELHTSQNEQATLREKGRDLKNAYDVARKTLKDKNQKLESVNEELNKTKQSEERLSEALTASEELVARLKSAKKEATSHNAVLQDNCHELQAQFNALQSLSVSLYDTDPNDGGTIQSLQDCWMSLEDAIHTAFEKPLPETIFKADWSQSSGKEIFDHHIPMPKSNSQPAKAMRIAVALGTLARLVKEYILQPTYVIPDHSDLTLLLNRQAKVNPEKESFLRGVLLSISAEDPIDDADELRTNLIDHFLGTAGFREILAEDQPDELRKSLDECLVTFQEIWSTVQHMKRRFEHSFDYMDDQFGWDYHSRQTQNRSNADMNDGPLDPSLSAHDGDISVILPRIYLMGGEPQPISRGTILLGSQRRAAAQESHSLSRANKDPFMQNGPGRARARTNRRQSVSLTGPTKGRISE